MPFPALQLNTNDPAYWVLVVVAVSFALIALAAISVAVVVAVLAARAGEYYETAAGKAGELAASAREAASRRGEQFSTAIEAGRQAYRDEKRRTESSALTENEPRALEGDA